MHHESGLMAFTETWFSEDVLDTLIQIDGFTHIRQDRNTGSGKSREWGVGIYVGDNWCRNIAVRSRIYNPDLELLLNLRPHYLPREFTNIFVCVVDVPPSGKATRAANNIADCVHKHLQDKPDAPMLFLVIWIIATLTNLCQVSINASNAILEIIIDLISVMETSRMPTQQELDHPSVILTTMLSSCSQHTGHCSNPVSQNSTL